MIYKITPYKSLIGLGVKQHPLQNSCVCDFLK